MTRLVVALHFWKHAIISLELLWILLWRIKNWSGPPILLIHSTIPRREWKWKNRPHFGKYLKDCQRPQPNVQSQENRSLWIQPYRASINWKVWPLALELHNCRKKWYDVAQNWTQTTRARLWNYSGFYLTISNVIGWNFKKRLMELNRISENLRRTLVLSTMILVLELDTPARKHTLISSACIRISSSTTIVSISTDRN